ncbi:MAG: T9SS type A sorting domain-containing protein [Bacteroidetes bacterium]|nr:T9SS type A sorting domain-containing protein [Bacteroidota bacterium]
MKKFLFLISFVSVSIFIKAQLSLTATAFKPVSGDVYNSKGFDSVTTVNKATGINKLWNFSAFTSLPFSSNLNTTYTTSSSTPSASAFPGATLASFEQGDPQATYQYYKTNGSNFEFMGISDNAPSAVSFSNTAIEAIYPVNYGSVYADTYGGTGTYQTNAATYTGTLGINASGTGTVMLPNNITLTNCLQVVTTRTINLSIQSVFDATVTSKYYDYYHNSQKFPVISIQYSKTLSFSGISEDFDALINTAYVLGVKENANSLNLSIYPNPVTDKLKLVLDNTNNEFLDISITDLTGKVFKEEKLNYNLNNEIDVSELNPGFYILNINSKGNTYKKKFVKE